MEFKETDETKIISERNKKAREQEVKRYANKHKISVDLALIKLTAEEMGISEKQAEHIVSMRKSKY